MRRTPGDAVVLLAWAELWDGTLGQAAISETSPAGPWIRYARVIEAPAAAEPRFLVIWLGMILPCSPSNAYCNPFNAYPAIVRSGFFAAWAGGAKTVAARANAHTTDTARRRCCSWCVSYETIASRLPRSTLRLPRRPLPPSGRSSKPAGRTWTARANGPELALRPWPSVNVASMVTRGRRRTSRGGRLAALAVVATLAALTVAGCGASSNPNDPRPAAQLEVSASVNPDKVQISPDKFGAGVVDTGPSRTSPARRSPLASTGPRRHRRCRSSRARPTTSR